MNVHRIVAVAALPCLCLLASKADAQDRRAPFRPIAFDLRAPAQVPASDQRVQELADPTPPHDGMLESVAVADNAEVGVGRFGVGTIARPRTNLERERMMERENRNIAGAGMRVRF